LINEFILCFTHTARVERLAPDIDATGLLLVVSHVGIISFENGKIRSEHIYLNQTTVLTQMSLLNNGLPVIGDTRCERLLDANTPAN
jgi:carboxymethylenebutenolidase